jgi:AraC family transcriptional regulator of arabinose operon
MRPTTGVEPAWRESDAGRRVVRVEKLPAFGALSSLVKDNIYWFGTQGLIFTSPWVVTSNTVRQTAVLLLTASGRPFELTVGDRSFRHEAVAIAPSITRGLRAIDVGLVSVNVQPHHPCFNAFRRIAGPGMLAFHRETFARFRASLVRAYEGRLGHGEAEQLFEDLVETAAAQLQGRVPRDDRAELLREYLREHPACSLGELARELNLSYTGASHLFARAVGLPLRSYQHWLKCMRATEQFDADVQLTQIAQQAGFTDLAHLSRSWQRRYGLSPSYLRDSEHVRVIA